MRLLVTNPDSIGDFMLREPMFSALTSHGHELMLVVRSLVAPLARLAAPEAAILDFEANPYLPGFEDDGLASLAPLLENIREFEPEKIVVGPYQRTLLDEHIVKSSPGSDSIGMSGHLYPGDTDHGLTRSSELQFGQTVSVSVDDTELSKNEALCSAILGRAVTLPPPALPLSSTMREQARTRIRHLGLEPGEFWIACVGHNRWTAVRNWQPAQWAALLSALVDTHRIRLLFVGTADENDATEAIRQTMGPAASGTVNLCAQSASLDDLVGLISESAGYVGRDTGPMHLAAALDKPVISIFGGGTWPRFVPAARVGVAITMTVSCSGCGWICHLRESHCIKQVPVSIAIEEANRILSEHSPLHIRAVNPDSDLLSRLNTEASSSFRCLLREGNRRHHQLKLRNQELEANLAPEKTELLRGMQSSLRSLHAQSEQELERERALLEKITHLEADTEGLRTELQTLILAHNDIQTKLKAIQRSIFSKLLVRAGIWNI